MKSKQEVIQQHYIDLLNADKFFKLKPHIDEDGWCLMFDEKGEKVSLTFKELGFEKDPLGKTVAGGLTQKGHKWRPKSLEGIESNNGWTRIESEEDLPKEDGTYYVMTKDGMKSLYWMSGMGKRYNVKKWMEYKPTHYLLEVVPKPPIY